MFIQHNFFTNVVQSTDILFELEQFKQAMCKYGINALPSTYKVKSAHSKNTYYLKLHNGTKVLFTFIKTTSNNNEILFLETTKNMYDNIYQASKNVLSFLIPTKWIPSTAISSVLPMDVQLKVEKNFLDTIAQRTGVIEKIVKFQTQMTDCNNIILNMPNGYHIDRFYGTNIYKFYLNDSDRILFQFDNDTNNKEIIFLCFATHDEQERLAYKFSNKTINTHTVSLYTYDTSYVPADVKPEIEISPRTTAEYDHLELLKTDGNLIQYITNPTDLECIAAVRQNGFSIRYIKNPTIDMQLSAVRQNPYSIEYIKQPCEEVQLSAVRRDGFTIKYIENPSEEIQLAAVRQNGFVVEHLENPSDHVKEVAICFGKYILYIDSEDVQLECNAI
ncbi:MAG: hypothetical protein ATN35_03415 [Epulopiscium sp. Nele67-Bin004]|nr:MAG: hypothetical protein ATN35_03415 [Epulopiscium sp. Nele67-Bin004]